MGCFSSQKPAVTPAPEKISQITPAGTTLFGTLGEGGEFVQTPGQTVQRTTETPEAQAIREQSDQLRLGVLAQLGGELQTPRTAQEIRNRVPFAAGKTTELDAPRLGRGLGSLSQGLPSVGGLDRQGFDDVKRLEDATFEGVKRRVQPEFDEQRKRLAQQLADQGIPVGSEAFDRELNRQEAAQGEVLTRAGLDAVAAGRGEQERLLRGSEREAQLGLQTREQLFGENISGRQQQFGEQVTIRQQAEEERRNRLLDSLNKQLSLSGLEQQQRAQQFGELGALGGFVNTFQPTPIGSLSQGQTGARAAGGGYEILGQLAGAAASAAAAGSDIRIKENISKVGNDKGFDIYEFNYIGGDQRYRGVMAQDVERTRPDAVITVDGIKHVFYDKIGIKMEAI